MHTFKELKEKNGSVTYDGVEYALYQEAYATNNCHGDLVYESICLTEEMVNENDNDGLNVHAVVQWEVYPEYLESNDTDESNACDWDHPVSMRHV